MTLPRALRILQALIARDFRGRYRRSLLGPAWAILQPVSYLLLFLFLRRTFSISSEGVPYVVFAFSALVPWAFFSNSVAWCGPSIYMNAGILKKIGVPREIFPVAAVATSSIDLLISSVLLAGMMIWFHVPVGLSLLWLPILVLVTALLALGVGLGLCAVGTYRRDVLFGLPFLMQFWLLATPVMYPLSQVPEKWRTLYGLNPMVGLVEGFRAVLAKGTDPDPGLLMASLAGTAVVWVIAWPLFRYTSAYFADVL